MAWTTKDIIDATGGTLLCGELSGKFTGISIDSRRIDPGTLFVAVRGAVHDAHRFAGDVVDSGGRGLVVERSEIASFPLSDWKRKAVACIAVGDTTRALGDMAAFHRNRLSVSVVAVTGSTGKTTTREMTAAVVSRKYTTLSSKKNYNNAFGLPLTLFELNRSHRWAIVELGMNRFGEISRLTEICRPDIGVITNVHPVHLEGVGSIEGVMRAKAELLNGMASEGRAVLNADDARVLQMAENTALNAVLFGKSDAAVVRAESLTETDGGVSFRLVLPDETIPVHLAVPGKFMVSNALAASTVGHLLGLSAVEIKTGLERFKAVTGRMHILNAACGAHVINDAYNANPVSMAAAIETLCALKKGNRGILVMGDMLELGQRAEALHRDIGAVIGGCGIERLYVTGAFSHAVESSAVAHGLNRQCVFAGTKDEIMADLGRWLRPDDWVLVKGSRGMGMEVVVDRLIAGDAEY